MPLPRITGRPTDSPAITLDHFTLDVVTVTGRATPVEFRLRDDRVEIWHHHRLAAAVDRAVLGGWLSRPERSLIVGDVMFNLDRSVDVRDRAAISLDNPHARITISLIDVRSWPLSGAELRALQDQL
jgi:hypothetical protein